jgi:transposase
VLECLRGEASIAELCRREGITAGRRSSWKPANVGGGDTARAATNNEVAELRREARALKEVVVEQALELRLPKKSMIVDGGDGQ